MVREDVTQVDADLDSQFSYTQVFANGGGQSGILDVLTVTRSGRLAILELKAGEYVHLPLQRLTIGCASADTSRKATFQATDTSAEFSCKTPHRWCTW